jgi:hypothetical protein
MTTFITKSIAILTLTAFFTFAAYSKEVSLLCNGTENSNSTYRGRETSEVSIEMKFNDETNVWTYATPYRLFGCYERGAEFIKSCNCNVSESSIICSSEVTKNKFTSTQNIRVNRLSGKLNFFELTSNTDSKDPYSVSKSGELICESFTMKKF